VAELFDRAAGDADLSGKALRRLDSHAEELGEINYDGPRSADLVMGHVYNLFGQMGELRVAVRLKGIVARGLEPENLGRFMGEGKAADVARARLAKLAQAYPHEMTKELDLLMDDGWLWSEVKNYNKPFGPGHRSYAKVMKQAKLSCEIRDLLQGDPVIARAFKAAKTEIRLRIYFVQGVTDEGARELEAMGIEVFGPRFPDELMLDEAA
jgi:hypothetical protein